MRLAGDCRGVSPPIRCARSKAWSLRAHRMSHHRFGAVCIRFNAVFAASVSRAPSAPAANSSNRFWDSSVPTYSRIRTPLAMRSASVAAVSLRKARSRSILVRTSTDGLRHSE